MSDHLLVRFQLASGSPSSSPVKSVVVHKADTTADLDSTVRVLFGISKPETFAVKNRSTGDHHVFSVNLASPRTAAREGDDSHPVYLIEVYSPPAPTASAAPLVAAPQGDDSQNVKETGLEGYCEEIF